MSKHEGVKTVVLGGHKDVLQQYCGVVGGQSTHFSEIDTEIKVCSFCFPETQSEDTSFEVDATQKSHPCASGFVGDYS